MWTGRYLDAVAPRVPEAPPARAVVAGGAAWLAARWPRSRWLGSPSAAPGGSADRRAVLRGLALWPLLSSRMLLAEVRGRGGRPTTDLGAGRTALSRIVSRDTSGLTEDEVRGAAVATLAENLSDSVVAPLFWYAAAGLPGAALHRYANTADACWGYRTPRWQHAGRVAARADDAAQPGPRPAHRALLPGPADLTAAAGGGTAHRSPNAGWPMAAMALRLDVRAGQARPLRAAPDGADPGPGDVEPRCGSRAVRRCWPGPRAPWSTT